MGEIAEKKLSRKAPDSNERLVTENILRNVAINALLSPRRNTCLVFELSRFWENSIFQNLIFFPFTKRRMYSGTSEDNYWLDRHVFVYFWRDFIENCRKYVNLKMNWKIYLENRPGRSFDYRANKCKKLWRKTSRSRLDVTSASFSSYRDFKKIQFFKI